MTRRRLQPEKRHDVLQPVAVRVARDDQHRSLHPLHVLALKTPLMLERDQFSNERGKAVGRGRHPAILRRTASGCLPRGLDAAGSHARRSQLRGTTQKRCPFFQPIRRNAAGRDWCFPVQVRQRQRWPRRPSTTLSRHQIPALPALLTNEGFGSHTMSAAQLFDAASSM